MTTRTPAIVIRTLLVPQRRQPGSANGQSWCFGTCLSLIVRKVNTNKLLKGPYTLEKICKTEETFMLMLLKDKYSCILGVIILLCNNPVTLLIRAPDKRGYWDNSKIIFLISQ